MSNLEKIVEDLSKLTVVQASELAKLLEEKWGVTASAPVAIAAPAAEVEAVAAQTEFDVILSETGANKFGVIKEIRALTTLGLKEAKDLVESAPKVLKTGVSKEEADKAKQALEAAGAKVEIK